jgi:ribose-phosphate pyrophosphokinase
MLKSNNRLILSAIAGASTISLSSSLYNSSSTTYCDNNDPHDKFYTQPSFGATINLRRADKNRKISTVSLDSLCLISGTANKELTKEIAEMMKVNIADSTIGRFADGEVSVQINENVRGKDVFIVQTCASPVNDSVMELLLTVSCVRRHGARRVTAVIPYFGYKHHRRGSPLSTLHQSRFLTSGAMDFAKMLQEMGVDRVIAADLQRPGQGQEACFFDNNVPLETILTTDYLVEYFIKSVSLNNDITVIAPNSECVKKANNVKVLLQKKLGKDVDLLAFFAKDASSGPTDTDKLELKGKGGVQGRDVLIIDDMVDTAGTLASLSSKLHSLGAKSIYVIASHGLFSGNASESIENSAVDQVFISNTLPLPKNITSKVNQVSIAPMLGQVILAEHFRTIGLAEEEFDIDDLVNNEENVVKQKQPNLEK